MNPRALKRRKFDDGYQAPVHKNLKTIFIRSQDRKSSSTVNDASFTLKGILPQKVESYRLGFFKFTNLIPTVTNSVSQSVTGFTSISSAPTGNTFRIELKTGGAVAFASKTIYLGYQFAGPNWESDPLWTPAPSAYSLTATPGYITWADVNDASDVTAVQKNDLKYQILRQLYIVGGGAGPRAPIGGLDGVGIDQNGHFYFVSTTNTDEFKFVYDFGTDSPSANLTGWENDVVSNRQTIVADSKTLYVHTGQHPVNMSLTQSIGIDIPQFTNNRTVVTSSAIAKSPTFTVPITSSFGEIQTYIPPTEEITKFPNSSSDLKEITVQLVDTRTGELLNLDKKARWELAIYIIERTQ